MVENDRSSNSHIQTGCLVCVLRNIYELVTNVLLHWNHPLALIAQNETSVSCERVAINRL